MADAAEAAVLLADINKFRSHERGLCGDVVPVQELESRS